MKKNYNFISLVALGHFNPSIMTPDFLNKTCELNLGMPTDQSPDHFPVLRMFQFDNLKINLELDRFQIQDIREKDIDKTKIIDVFKSFYNKLPYTPINTVGINVNGKISFEKDDNIKILTEKAISYEAYRQFYKTNKIIVTDEFFISDNKKEWIKFSVKIEDPDGLTKAIQAVRERDGINFNFNYEADKLISKPDKLNILLDNYKNFCIDFNNFILQLEVN